MPTPFYKQNIINPKICSLMISSEYKYMFYVSCEERLPLNRYTSH